MIYFKGIDNSVAIMELAPEADKADAIQKFMNCHQGFYKEYFEGDIEVPSDRQFRDAWKLQQGKIVVDSAKARAIHLSRIRKVRDEMLNKLDKEQLRQDSPELQERKQVLRDLPNNVKGLEWPKELNEC